PSSTYSGTLLPSRDVVPRMRTAMPPGTRITRTPGKRPISTCSIGCPGLRWMSSEVTTAPGFVAGGLAPWLVFFGCAHPARVAIRAGRLTCALERDGRALLLPSVLGFAFRGAPPLRDSLQVTDTARQTVDDTWTQPWGEVARVRDHHNELRVSVAETAAPPPGRRFAVVFRVFNDGVGFRYEVPAQPGLGEFEISDELTEFALADDARAWWI